MTIKVSLRSKAISGKRQGLYLDFYPAIPHPETDVPTRREFLNMFLYDECELEEIKYPDKNGKEQKRYDKVIGRNESLKKRRLSPLEKQHNEQTSKLAEQIKIKRENQLNKPEIYTGYEKNQLKIKEKENASFLCY